MKRMTNKILVGLFLLSLFGCKDKLFTDDPAGFDTGSDLRLYEISLTNPGQNAAMVYVDLSSGGIYDYTDATKQPEKIDLIYLWDDVSGGNLLSPDNTMGLGQWTKGVDINQNWFIKNQTTYIRLAKASVPADFYGNIKSSAGVKDAYHALKVLVEAQPGYDEAVHGEGPQVSNLAVGDLLGVKTGKNVYAIAKVQSLSTGGTGALSIATKIDRREEEPVPPLAESEVFVPYHLTLDKLNDLTGQSLLDLTTGQTYSVADGYYHQNVIDAVVYHDGQDLVIASVSENNIPDLNERVVEIRGDWELRTTTKFIRLKGSADTDARWYQAYQNSKINAFYNTAEDIVTAYDDYDAELYGPSASVKGIQTGDLILYHSQERNVYGMIRVTDSGPEFLQVEGRASAFQKEELPLPRLKEFTSTGAATSTAAYVDFKTGNIYLTEAEGQANAANIDVISVRGSNTGNNLTPVFSHAGIISYNSAWGNRIAGWPNRPEGYVYGLGTASAAWDLYHSLKEDASMRTVFEAETASMTPPSRLTQVTNKGVIFYHGVGRNILVALKVMDISTPTSITYRYKIIEL